MAERSSAYWRDRAEEARTLAAEMSDEYARKAMIEVVTLYEKLAQYTDKLESTRPKLTGESPAHQSPRE